uniref:Transmembrane protein FAM155A n=1 Tax=Aceria tosichella TaxID=561515 RepID=A0A6G1SIK3_9ACAR
MLARIYSPRRIISAILSIELCLSVFTSPTREQSPLRHQPGDFSLVEAYASNNNINSNNNNNKRSLFVQQLDQTTKAEAAAEASHQHHYHSSLFYSSSSASSQIGHDQDHHGLELRGDLGGGGGGVSSASLYDEQDQDNGISRPIAGNHHHEHRNHFDDSLETSDSYPSKSYGPGGGGYDDDRLEDSIAPLDDRILLTRKFIQLTCHQNRGIQRKEQLNNTYLTYCYRYKLENLFSYEIQDLIMHADSHICERILDEFIQLDETINMFDSLFIKLLSRYNCHNGYSVKWNCDDCKKAYKDWLCATHLPFYMRTERIKPCISFCERVEQRCPYLHPITREQYGGQPVFICRDPNIPFVPEITPDIPYSEPGRCYDLCHLSDNLTELITDSLSKYDYDKCPDRNSIAGGVQSDSLDRVNDSKLPGFSAQDDYTDISSPDESDDDLGPDVENRTRPATKVLLGTSADRKRVMHVHNKKLDELREVLANYKNQAKTHRYHAEHSSIEHTKSQSELNHSS